MLKRALALICHKSFPNFAINLHTTRFDDICKKENVNMATKLRLCLKVLFIKRMVQLKFHFFL